MLLHKRLVGSSRVRVCRSKTGLLASCTRVLERKTRTKTFLFIVLDRLPTDFARKWGDKTPNPWASPPLVKWDEKAGVTPSLGDQLRLYKSLRRMFITWGWVQYRCFFEVNLSESSIQISVYSNEFSSRKMLYYFHSMAVYFFNPRESSLFSFFDKLSLSSSSKSKSKESFLDPVSSHCWSSRQGRLSVVGKLQPK